MSRMDGAAVPRDASPPRRREHLIRFGFGACFGALPAAYVWLQFLPMGLGATLALFAAFGVASGALACLYGDEVWLTMLDRFRGIF